MADTVKSAVTTDGPRNYIVTLTNESDGTGESKVAKIDVSTLAPPCETVRIDRIVFSTHGMAASLYWDATADELIATLPADTADDLIFGDAGLQNPKPTGWTGDILVSTHDHTAGDSYAIQVQCTKQGVSRG